MKNVTLLESEIKKQWDVIAPWWVEHVRRDVNRTKVLFPMIFTLLGNLKNKRVLDAGCGEGILSRALCERMADVVGVDYAHVLDYAKQEERRNPLGITYIDANISKLTLFPDHTFNVIVCNLVLQGSPDIARPLKEFHRLLVKDGILLITIHNPSLVIPGSAWFKSWLSIKTQYSQFNNGEGYLVSIEDEGPYIYYFHRSLERYLVEINEAGFFFKEHFLNAADEIIPLEIKDHRLFLLVEANPS